MPTLLIHDARCVATLEPGQSSTGQDLRDASVFIRDGRIAFVGATRALPAEALEADEIIDARGHLVTPGLIHTPLTARVYADAPTKAAREALVPLHRIGAAEADIAGVVAFLIGPDAGYITGQNILADGGLLDATQGLIPGRPATQR